MDKQIYWDSWWAGWRWTSRYIGIVVGQVGDGQADNGIAGGQVGDGQADMGIVVGRLEMDKQIWG